ncbi:unnamed protein product, partial [Vitis vinifera]|uniref:Uncharacterized protein n=1 Tax=Vitis vinifera TaxID=29760 RepID=D7T8L3_VITVI
MEFYNAFKTTALVSNFLYSEGERERERRASPVRPLKAKTKSLKPIKIRIK